MYICKSNNSLATGDFCEQGFIVYKGSKISDHTTKTFELNGYKVLRNRLIDEGIISNGVFASDYVFSSISAAACVVGGRMSSGLKDWKETVAME